jgi:predicted  nucleic acid-binding Zn-ribbon protein
MEVRASISVGELIDKITILEIKLEKIKDSKKLKNIENELDILNEHFKKIENDELSKLKNNLKNTNLKLWQIEDDIRLCEKNQDFSSNFVDLARSVYITNDERFEFKNSINEIFSSEIKEVKSYEEY